MPRVMPAALVGAVLWGLTAMAATAQDVPVPKPAPQPKSGAVSPSPSMRTVTPGPPLPLAPGQPVPGAVVLGGRLSHMDIARPGGQIVADASQRTLIERVNGYLSGVYTLTGDFVQVAPDGSRTNGKFYLQKPGRMRFEYNPPSPVELIADGSSLVVRDRKLATQDLYPLSQTPLRFLLAERIDLMRDTNLAAVYADDMFVTMVIEEKQIVGGTHRLMLMFGARDFQLRQWTITDPQGYDTTVAVYNLDSRKQQLDPGLFKINYERVLQ